MSNDFQDFSTYRSRKVRQCEECRKAIEIGELYLSIRGKYDGDFYAFSAHPECAEMSEQVRHALDLVHDDEYRGLYEEIMEFPTSDPLRQAFDAFTVGKRSYKEATADPTTPNEQGEASEPRSD